MYDSKESIDYGWLLRLRLLIARYGEMDSARWWNTNGVMGKYGAIALSRGFPKTQALVRGRIAMEAAKQRCNDVFQVPGCITLWSLPPEVEDGVEQHVNTCLNDNSGVLTFLQELESVENVGLGAILQSTGFVSQEYLAKVLSIPLSGDARTIAIPGTHSVNAVTVALLAAGFTRSDIGRLIVPYARLEN